MTKFRIKHLEKERYKGRYEIEFYFNGEWEQLAWLGAAIVGKIRARVLLIGWVMDLKSLILAVPSLYQ